MGLVPEALPAGAAPVRRLGGLSVGGGDGVALGEVLREPAVGLAHVVDRGTGVLRRGREQLGCLNVAYARCWRIEGAGAWEDARICKFGVPGGGEPWKATQGNKWGPA